MKNKLSHLGDHTKTGADLHYTIQITMGWTDQHLNQFTIYGKGYGVYHDGGIAFSDDPQKTRLDQFNFRLRDRFRYEYNFHDSWKHEIRLEKTIDFAPGKIHPFCMGGSRGTPPEECGGDWTFMKLKQRYSQQYLIDLIAEMAHNGEKDINIEEINNLKYWMNIDHFDRCIVNHKLAHFAKYGFNPEHWNQEMELCV